MNAFEIIDLGRCTFTPPKGAPPLEDEDGVRRITKVPKISTAPDMEPAPGALMFKMVGDVAVPADSTTRETFQAVQRAQNRYLAMAGLQLAESAVKLLNSERIIGAPLRVPTDGKLTDVHVVAYQAIALDFAAKTGTTIAIPDSVAALARGAREWVTRLAEVITSAASGVVVTEQPRLVKKKKSRIKIAVGTGVALTAAALLLRR